MAGFSSLYVFGDGVSTTTNNTLGGSLYYGRRYTNGRVWVEVLAQRQGLVYAPEKNWSYFGHYSSQLVTNLNAFSAPDAASALFAVWIADADFVYNVGTYPTNNSVAWSNAIALSLTNHWRIITNLYAKGARTLILPNAVDLMKVPAYVYTPPPSKDFIRQRIVEFNSGLAELCKRAQTSLPAIRIIAPDLFKLLDDMVSNPVVYGLTNALLAGESVAALDDPAVADYSLNGPGAGHIFWDDLDPSARAHAVLADVIQRLLSPARIQSITPVGEVTQLEVANVPIGRSGFVDGTTNLRDWMPIKAFDCTNSTQTVLIPASAQSLFYRLRFSCNWTWP